MSVLVKGMELPKNCNVCNFHMLRFCCAADKDLAEKDTRPLIERRPESCPLVPVPEHGRLIDLDGTALAQYYDEEHEEWSMETVTVEDILWGVCENMPPIVIPADKGGEPC